MSDQSPVGGSPATGQLLRSPHIAAFMAIFFIGINFVIVRAVYEQYPPSVLSLWRWGGAAVLLLCFTWRGVIAEWPMIRRNFWIYVLMAFLMPISGALASFVAMEWTVAVNGAIIQSLIPALVIVIAWMVGLEKVGGRQMVGLILALIGVGGIVTRADLAVLTGLDFNIGDLILLASSFGLAAYTVMYKCIKEKPSPTVFLTVLCGLGGLMHLPFLFYELAIGTPMPFNLETSLSMAYVAVFPSLIAILLFNYGIDRLGPSRAAAYHYFLAPITAAAAFLFIGEKLLWYHGVGTALIFAGVFLASGSKQKDT
ncbi:MAG: EamA family transporter [Alphaproteobacteria bacterium]|nr:EamA family transporter [Alphaproteobacteria bacterium]